MVGTRRTRSKKQDEESPKRSSIAAAIKGPPVVAKKTLKQRHGAGGKLLQKQAHPQASTNHHNMSDRWDPVQRGIHSDGIVAGQAPSSAAECVDCGKKISQGSYRWGIKYGGNPLPVPVLPLYGSHPMYLWCHAGGCGLAFVRACTIDSCEAAQTCHLCQDKTKNSDDDDDDDVVERNMIKLLCGGPAKGKKIRQHAFHWSCWQKAIRRTAPNEEALEQLLIPPPSVQGKCGLSWNELSPQEQQSILLTTTAATTTTNK